MRRREPAATKDAMPPRFVYADWADEQADGPPPDYWPAPVSMWWQIRAFKRYLEAKHAARERMNGV